ncbi:MAG TPA: hypothetical protein VM734_05505 [Kofleriaceae bacterium]|nr:hypothetical protein [Kofleriaceae bacterium]
MTMTNPMNPMTTALALVAALASLPHAARADEPRLATTPPPYALPWQLRPIAPGNVVRSDTTVAGYATADGRGATVASTLLASYKVSPTVAPLVRVAVVRDLPPAGAGATTMSNPLLGVLYGKPLAPAVKLGLFAAFTVPVGGGGGDTPDAARAAANRAGIAARSSMDNALFAVNDHALIGGADLAYVAGGLTVQAELTVFQLTRVRGGDVQPDKAKTNFTSGLHAGWFARPWLSVGGELRYQRWLSTPQAVAGDPTGASRDNLTAAAGLRGHIALPGKRWLRPGLAYARALDDPMRGKGYDIVQVDVPFVF